MTAESESLKGGSRTRLIVLWIGTIVAVLILSARLFYWQVIRYEYLQKEKEGLLVPPKAIPALRGTIMDRHGFVLATDTYEFQVFATPRDIDESDGLATELAPVLGVDQSELAQLPTPTIPILMGSI